MTLQEVLAQVDELKPNVYDDNIKILWLSELDGKIFRDVILTHERDDDTLESFDGYTEEDLDTELLVGFPHADIYRLYLMAQIDFSNGEMDRYAASQAMYAAAYKDFISDYNRSNMPISHTLKF